MLTNCSEIRGKALSPYFSPRFFMVLFMFIMSLNPDCAVEIYYDDKNATATLISRFCSVTVFQEYASLTKSLQFLVSQAFSSSHDDSNSTIWVKRQRR
jgi:hypothetical protein